MSPEAVKLSTNTPLLLAVNLVEPPVSISTSLSANVICVSVSLLWIIASLTTMFGA